MMTMTGREDDRPGSGGDSDWADGRAGGMVG